MRTTVAQRLVATGAVTAEQLARLADQRSTLQQLVAELDNRLGRARDLFVTVRARRDDVVTDLTLPRGKGPAPLQDRETWRLHVAYASRRDPVALEHLVTTYLPRAEHHARVRTRRLVDLDDRLQVAREALVVALQRFDPTRRVPFRAFADATIAGQLQKHIRDHGWLLRAPRRVHELIPAIRVETERLTHELGRVPTPSEVASALGCPIDDVLMALSAHQARTHESLDALFDDERSAHEHHGHTDQRVRAIDDRDALRRALATLSTEDRDLLRDYFIIGKTQQQIADEVGHSQMHVSRRLRRVLRVLAARMSHDDRACSDATPSTGHPA